MLYVQKGRDWENKKSTVIFTSLDESGIASWSTARYLALIGATRPATFTSRTRSLLQKRQADYGFA